MMDKLRGWYPYWEPRLLLAIGSEDVGYMTKGTSFGTPCAVQALYRFIPHLLASGPATG